MDDLETTLEDETLDQNLDQTYMHDMLYPNRSMDDGCSIACFGPLRYVAGGCIIWTTLWFFGYYLPFEAPMQFNAMARERQEHARGYVPSAATQQVPGIRTQTMSVKK